jgi:hypothetical protein
MNKKNVSRVLVAIIALFILLTIVCCLTACGNKDMFDTVYAYDYAIISLPNGEIVEGKVQNWTDYEGDQIQVKIDGKIYLVHSEDIALIKE